MAKWNKDKIRETARKVPRMTYLLMFFLSFYMIYIIGKMIGGLSEPDVSGTVLIYIAIGFFALIGLVFIIIGGWALFTKNYLEEWHSEDIQKEDNEQP